VHRPWPRNNGAGGQRVPSKEVASEAIAFRNLYLAPVAIGANQQQMLPAYCEAEAYDGPSLILVYSHCIAHGLHLRCEMKQPDLARTGGNWPLFRYNPATRGAGQSVRRPQFFA